MSSDSVPVYDECSVDLRAEMASEPKVELPQRTEGSSGCYNAFVDVVVDTLGRLEVPTAVLVRTNYADYGNAVMRQLDLVRYRPAEKDRHRVKQLVHHKSAIAYVIQRVGPGAVAASPRITGGPKC